MKWYHWLFRPLFNVVGELRGNSGCGVCGDRWNWKEPHVVRLLQESGVFPTCEECWQTASTEEIVRAATKLGNMWVRQSDFLKERVVRRNASRMVAAVEEAAKKRCCVCPVGPKRKGIVPAACVGCAIKEIEKEASS